jgi:photosystem II oxygen-evolving enhancer protein 2
MKRIAAILLIVLALGLQGCVSSGSGLQSYVDSYDGYEFLYPTGWVKVKVANGPDVVYRDLINETENVSVVINPIPEGETLADLGTPTDVGYKLAKSISALADTERDVDLISAETRQNGTETYYLLEYEVDLPQQQRHNLASVVVRRGQLFTFNASTLESRWSKVGELLRQSVQSFSVY